MKVEELQKAIDGLSLEIDAEYSALLLCGDRYPRVANSCRENIKNKKVSMQALQNELQRAEGCPCWYDSENQWIVTACGCYINYYDDIEEYENGYCATCGKRLDLTEVYETLQPTEGE